MALSIRAAVVDDARAIAEIHVAGWRATYRGHMPNALLDGLSVDQRAEHRTRDIASPRSPEHRTWVAEDEGGIAAFAVSGPSRDADATAGVSEVFAIYADPPRIGTGVGRALLAHVLDDLRDRGVVEVTLWVLDANSRARRFYETAGFERDGAGKDGVFGATALRELRYRRRLQP